MEATVYSKLTLPPKTRKALAPAMASWRSLHKEIRHLPDSNESLTTLAQMMVLEIHREGGAREQLLGRLHMRINAMRQRMEVENIEKATGVKIVKSPVKAAAPAATPARKASAKTPAKRATH